jgi:hypothetical protein
MDLTTDLPGRPVARQLRQSLLAYLGSEAFQPKVAIALEDLRKLVGTTPSNTGKKKS